MDLDMRDKNFQVKIKHSVIYDIVKRIFDIIFSLIAIILTFPLVLIVCVLVKLDSKGSAIYSQKRVGLNNKEFYCYKIRSMKQDAEVTGAQWAEKNDPRITRVGKIIRKTRIDEIPQFYNILLGDMSLVGPRPEREIFYKEFEKDILGFRKRLLVKPGLTGYAQVNGGYEASPKEKLDMDLYYIEHRGYIIDFKIILKTFKVVITGEGAR